MTGSLQIKNGKYYMVLNCTQNGKRKQKWIGTNLEAKGNKRKAEQMLRDRLQEAESPQPAGNDTLFSECVRYWLTVAKRRVDPVTYQGYALMANAQVIPYFEERRLRLRDITRQNLQEFFDEKATNGRKDGKGALSPSSLRQYKNIINQALNEAVKDSLLPSNPCQFVVLPQKVKYEAHYLSAGQLQTLFDAIADDPLAPLVRITALYGLRRSELLGIKWDSVDFESNLVTIRHTVTKVTVAVAKDKTKNASSHRSFPLMPEARAIFNAAKQAERDNRRLFGKSYVVNDYVFKWPDGRPFSPDYITQHFASLLKKHGMPRIRFHELRHSCASLLLNRGCTLKDVQEWMGHADIQMTANIYGHLDMSRKQTIGERLSDTLFTAR